MTAFTRTTDQGQTVSEPPKVTVNRSLLFSGAGRVVPYSWLYEVTGPDGHQFTNKSIGDLRTALRRRYGKAVQIHQNWEGPARAVRWSDINRPVALAQTVSEVPGKPTMCDDCHGMGGNWDCMGENDAAECLCEDDNCTCEGCTCESCTGSSVCPECGQ